MSLCMSPTVNSITSFLARASPMHCLLPTPNGTRAGCFLYLTEHFRGEKRIFLSHLPSSPMNLSGMNWSGLWKCLLSLMMKCKLETKVLPGGTE